jgi:hypothetical protein
MEVEPVSRFPAIPAPTRLGPFLLLTRLTPPSFPSPLPQFALPAPDAPLSRGARVRNFVLTGESGSRLHGCSLTWFVRGEAPPPQTGTSGDGGAGGSGGGAASGDDGDSDSGDDNDSSMAGKENAGSSSSPPPTPSRAVHLCVVLVSKLPAYAALAGLVRALVGQMEGAGNDPEARVSRLSSAAASLLRSVPTPLPGGAVAVHFDRVVAEERAEPAATFSLPPLHAHPVAVEEESLLLLFRLLSPAAVVTLFRVLAGEGRLVLRVPDDAVGLLAPVCDALTALLYPLAWAHAYIPLLPSGFDLESMLEAPCPFIVGAPESAFASLPPSSLADLTVVDLGTGHVTVPGETSASAGGNSGSGRGGWLSPAFGGAAAATTATTAAAAVGDGGRGAGGSCPVPALPARVHRQLILSLQHFAKGVYGPASCRAAFGALANARPTVIADDDDDDDDDEDVEDDAAGHATARYECGTWRAASAQQGGFGRLGVQRAFLDAMLLLLGDYDDHMRATTAEEEGAAGASSSAAAAAGRYLGLTFDRAAALSCKGEYEPFVSHLYATQAFDSFLASRLRLSAWTDPHVLYFDAVVDSVVMGKPSAFLLGPAAIAAAAETEKEEDGAAAAAAAPTGSATDSAALPLLRVTCPVPLRAPAADDASGATLVPPPVSFESAYTEALQRAMAAAAEAGPLSPDGVRSPAGAAAHPAGAQLSSPAALVCSPGGAAGATQLDARVNRDRLRCRRLSVLQGQQVTADAAGEGAGTAAVADATTAAASGAAPSAAPAAPGPTAQRPGFNAWISRVFAAKPAAAVATSAAAEPVPPPPAPASSSPPRAAAKRVLDTGASEPAAGACSSPSTAPTSSVHAARALPASLGSPPTASKARRVPASSRALLASPLPASTITPALASPVMHAQSTRKRRRMLAVAADPSLASLASVTEGDDAAELDGDGVGIKGAAAGAASGSTAAAAASTIASPVHTVDFSAFVAAPSTTATTATTTTTAATTSEMSSAAAAAASAQAAAACAESAAADVRSLRVEVTRARQEAAAARVQARELAEALSHALDTIAQMERERRALVEEVQVLRRAAQGGGKGSGDEDEEVEEMEGADVDSERGGPGLVRMETFDGQEWRQLRTTGHLGDGGGGPVVAAVPAAAAAPPPVPAPAAAAAAAAAAASSTSSSAASPAPSRIPTLRSRGGGLSPFRLGSPRRVPVAGKGVGEVGTGEASSSAKVL